MRNLSLDEIWAVAGGDDGGGDSCSSGCASGDDGSGVGGYGGYGYGDASSNYGNTSNNTNSAAVAYGTPLSQQAYCTTVATTAGTLVGRAIGTGIGNPDIGIVAGAFAGYNFSQGLCDR